MAKPLDEQTLMILFMQGLTDGPVRTNIFRLEFDTLEEAIRVAEQEDFSVNQAHVSSNSYRPPRRQESGGPEPMDLCYAENESSHVINYKKLHTCNSCQNQGIMHTSAVLRTRYCIPQERVTVKRPRRVRGVGPTLLRKRNTVTDDQKSFRVSWCGAPY